jgi:hypothetical protein
MHTNEALAVRGLLYKATANAYEAMIIHKISQTLSAGHTYVIYQTNANIQYDTRDDR